jgi:hypothetical protein
MNSAQLGLHHWLSGCVSRFLSIQWDLGTRLGATNFQETDLRNELVLNIPVYITIYINWISSS